MTSPQIGSNGTARGNGTQASSDIEPARGFGGSPTGASGTDPASDHPSLDFGKAHGDVGNSAASTTTQVSTPREPDGGVGMVDSIATSNGSRAGVETVSLPDAVLTSGGQFSIGLGGADQPNAPTALLSVYIDLPDALIRSEGQFMATDRGSTLALARVDNERTAAPSLASAAIMRSVRGYVPVSESESLPMQVDLMSDATLVVSAPESASLQSAESLAAYSLVMAKKGLSVSTDKVRAIVLQFGSRGAQ